MGNMNWDEIQDQLKKAIKLDKNKEDLTVTITVLEENIEQNQMVGGLLKGEAEMKQGLSQFLGHPLDCDVSINEADKIITMTFKNKKDWKKVHEFLNEMFFGDFLKKMMEAMMGAFGDMFKGD